MHYYCIKCKHPVSICECEYPLVRDFEQLIKDLDILEAKLKIAVETLGWYSTESNYKVDCLDEDCPGEECLTQSEVKKDWGARAMEAISKIGNVEINLEDLK